MAEEHVRTIPRLEDFLIAPASAIAAVAPASVAMAVGGSRRDAALNGVATDTDAYAEYTRQRMMEMLDRLFQHGVQQVFTAAIRAGQFREAGRYRDKLLCWNERGLAGDAALADYARLGWRVRLVGIEDVPELQAAAARLVSVTPQNFTHTVWWTVSRTDTSPWDRLLGTAVDARARTQKDAIRAVYGEDIPPITMMLSFGKPMIVSDIVPPLLIGDMQCYWYQRPGYAVTDRLLRRIFYDYAYSRRTWRSRRDDRYDAIAQDRALWDNDIVLGLGRRIGDFWFPLTYDE